MVDGTIHNHKSRTQYIVMAVAIYALAALAWIFLSDQLLLAFTDTETVFRLSLAKGVFFVFTSAFILLFVLNAVPDRRNAPLGNLLEITFARSLILSKISWLKYVLIFAFTLVTLWFANSLTIEQHQRLLLLIFMLPISLSAICGGFAPGLIATLLSVLCVYYLNPTANDLENIHSTDWLQLISLSIYGIVISALSGYLRASLQKLDMNHQLLDSVVSQTTDGIFVKDLSGRYLLVNHGAAVFVGKTMDEIVGQDDTVIFDADSASIIREKDRMVLASGEVMTQQECVHIHGEDVVFQVTKGPVIDSQGTICGLFGIARDVTSQEKNAERLRISEAGLRLAQQLSGIGSWEWDLLTDSHTWSEQVFVIYGLPHDQEALTLAQVESLFTPESWQMLTTLVTNCINTGEAYECEAELIHPDNSHHWIMARGQAQRNEQGKITKLHGTVQNITQARQLQHQLAAQTAQLQRVIQGSEQGYWDWNAVTGEVQLSPRFEAILGYQPGEMQLTINNWHQYVHAEDVQTIERQVLQHLRHKTSSIELEVRCIKKSGEPCWVLCKGRVVEVDNQGRPLMISGTQADITLLKTHEAELDRVANYDALTGLPNRRLLLDRFEQTIARVNRNRSICAVCFMDLDGFKVINDRYGHEVGDQLLVAIVDNVSMVIREQDTLARVGGDEFVILFEMMSEAECTQVLLRILEAVDQDIVLADRQLHLSASIGVSLYPEDNVDPDILLRHADQAMYMAKAAGKNRFQMFDPDIERNIITRRQWIEELKLAYAHHEFVMFYQPKVNLATGKIIGVEALIRWQHPQRGIVAPNEFLPDIAGSEFEIALGEWVINTAMAQCQRWQQEGRPLKVSVNVSARQLLAEHFYDFLQSTLIRHPDVAASALELEILESAAIEDMALAIEILKECKRLGFHFSLDDFGTGYSSLTYLRQLPISTIKIDQSFVLGMLENEDDLRIVEGVIRLASVFNLKVIAEGVETIAHGKMLADLGCQSCQGYGIARPMPVEELALWYDKWPVQYQQIKSEFMPISIKM
jgi:diguanylate cyclase (GGDEF)-like protein/PAS domain S-box-containing protein